MLKYGKGGHHMRYFVIYLFLLNIFTFILFGIDKSRARKNRYRISEKTLFVFSLLGGSVGALASMLLFHHKTRKPVFFIGIPFILLLQCILLYLCFID